MQGHSEDEARGSKSFVLLRCSSPVWLKQTCLQLMPLLFPLCFGIRIPVCNVQHKYYCLELLSASNHFLFEQDSRRK